MSLKHMGILILLAIAAMFYITEKNLDYSEFVKFVNKTQPHRKDAPVEVNVAKQVKNYGGVFAAGNCIKLDEIDYFKIIDEDADSYTHVLCKFGGRCLTTPTRDKRTDFEITYSESDIVLCPLEEE